MVLGEVTKQDRLGDQAARLVDDQRDVTDVLSAPNETVIVLGVGAVVVQLA